MERCLITAIIPLSLTHRAGLGYQRQNITADLPPAEGWEQHEQPVAAGI
jgi:hypothetical protein